MTEYVLCIKSDEGSRPAIAAHLESRGFVLGGDGLYYGGGRANAVDCVLAMQSLPCKPAITAARMLRLGEKASMRRVLWPGPKLVAG